LDYFAKVLGYRDRTETEKIITALRKAGLKWDEDLCQ
jgi:hypothetical protein